MWRKLSSSLKYIKYGKLISENGATHLIDTMRYDELMFGSHDSIRRYQNALANHMNFITNPIEIIVLKYCFSKKESMVTESRLLSHQRFEPINDLLKIDTVMDFHLAKPISHVSELTVTGYAVDIIDFMGNNRVMLACENDSHKIEDSIHHPDKKLEVLFHVYSDSRKKMRLINNNLNLEFKTN